MHRVTQRLQRRAVQPVGIHRRDRGDAIQLDLQEINTGLADLLGRERLVPAGGLPDQPAGVGRPSVSSAGSGTATLTWLASADLA